MYIRNIFMFNTTPKEERGTGMTDGEFVPPSHPLALPLCARVLIFWTCAICRHRYVYTPEYKILLPSKDTFLCNPLFFYVTLYLLKVLES